MTPEQSQAVERELMALKWAVSCLAGLCGERGSPERENGSNAAAGIEGRIDRLIFRLRQQESPA